MVIYSLYSCIPIIHNKTLAVFTNCTNDTVYIGVSYYNNIDSVYEQANPHYIYASNKGIDNAGISLWNRINFKSDNFVLPDSTCSTDADFLFHDTDTCYFFVIKLKDAKRHSWAEICKMNLFYKQTVIKDAEGNFDKNIRYSGPK